MKIIKNILAGLLILGSTISSFSQDRLSDLDSEDVNKILKFNIIQETTKGEENYLDVSPLEKAPKKEEKEVKIKIVDKNKTKEINVNTNTYKSRNIDITYKSKNIDISDLKLVNYLLERKFSSPSNATSKDIYQDNVENNSQANNKENQNENIKNTLYTEGYCVVDREIIVNRLDMYSTFPCYFDKLGTATVFGRLVPNPSALSLLFKPIAVRTAEGISFKVANGFVLDGTRTTNNIADYVNNRALEKIFYKSLAEGTSATTKAYEDYFKNKNKKTTFVPNSSGGNAVVVENKYDSNYPVTMGFMSLVDSLINNTLQYFTKEIDNMPVLFKIEAGKKIYMELELSPKEAVYREPLTKDKVKKVKEKVNKKTNSNNKEIKIKIGE